jgi:protein-S-isoprenylcysteine O-methyltransferase Ste14
MSMSAETSSPRGVGWVIGQMLLQGVVAVVALRFRRPRPPACAIAGGAALLGYAAWMGLDGVPSLGRNLTPLPAPRDDGELVTSGIFARVRHPLYASVMAIGFGWVLLSITHLPR